MYSKTKIALLSLAGLKTTNILSSDSLKEFHLSVDTKLDVWEIDRLKDKPTILKQYYIEHFSGTWEDFLTSIPTIKKRYPNEWEHWKDWGSVTVCL